MSANGQIIIPDTRALQNAHRDEIFSTLNCHQMGTIVSFDEDTQAATISLNVKRVVFNKEQASDALQSTPNLINYPILVQCPVFVPGGGKLYIGMPPQAGDECLVLFNDRDMDTWFITGSVSQPNSPRMHSLSDGLAIVGFRSNPNAIAGYPTTANKLRVANDAMSMLTMMESVVTAMQDIVLALTALNAKTGPDASGAIATASAAVAASSTDIGELLQ